MRTTSFEKWTFEEPTIRDIQEPTLPGFNAEEKTVKVDMSTTPKTMVGKWVLSLSSTDLLNFLNIREFLRQSNKMSRLSILVTLKEFVNAELKKEQ